MAGADDYQPLRAGDGIEKDPRRAARLDTRGRPHRAVSADLEQRRHRIRGALTQLLRSRRAQAGETVERRRAPRYVDHGALTNLRGGQLDVPVESLDRPP